MVEARNGLEAVQVLDGRAPATGFSLVLLDLMLPIVDGFGVLSHLTERGDDTAVVAMSASGSHLEAARDAGAQAVLPKLAI